MNQEIKSIAIYSENHQIEGCHIPLIYFQTNEQKESVEKYIEQKVGIFFKKIIQLDIDLKTSQIDYTKMITQKDFRKKQIKYFYENLFDNIGQRNSNGKLNFVPKWGITFDEKCTPIQVSMLGRTYVKKIGRDDYNPKFELFNYKYKSYTWNYRYGTIDINGQPIFYYIYFTLQELLDVIKE